MLEPLTVWITTNCETVLKRWRYQTTFSVSSETCLWVKKQQLEGNMENGIVQNWKGIQQGVQVNPKVNKP